MKNDRVTRGRVELAFDGVQDGEVIVLELGDVTPAESRRSALEYKFKYFQTLTGDLLLPEGFTPRKVVVTATPTGKKQAVLEQIENWSDNEKEVE